MVDQSVWLAIDTSTRNCSVAVFRAMECLHAIDEYEEGKYNHAERLHSLIDEVLRHEALLFSDLSAIVVGDGPGSYTGLRIGVSAAKGYAYALNIPLYSVPSLDALYFYWKDNGMNEMHCIAAIDARRMEAFVKVFSNTRGMETQPLIFDEHTFDNWEGTIAIVGDAAEKLKGLYDVNQVRLYQSMPSALWFAESGWGKQKKGEVENLAYYAPNYGKAFVAGKPKKKA